jgi:hypothetical protein
MQAKWSRISSYKTRFRTKQTEKRASCTVNDFTNGCNIMEGVTIDDFTNGHHIGTETTNLATNTMDDFTDGRKGALLMISLMDTTEGGEWNNLMQTNSLTWNHQVELKLTLAISKQVIFDTNLILQCQVANCPLKIN